MMQFTGERYLPTQKGQIYYEHIHRYALCRDFVSGKSVLDIACGEGYGSALLATAAASVVGVDINEECIESAKKQYDKYQNLRFTVGACEAIPIAAQSIDVVVSFETIEHHDKHQEMMLEIKRVLKSNGVLIISSPNRLIYSDLQQYSNPYHVKELYFEELVKLLKQHFNYVEFFGQKVTTGSFIFPLSAYNNSFFSIYESNTEKIARQNNSLAEPVYFIVVCSNVEMNTQFNFSSVYVDSTENLLKEALLKLEQAAIEIAEVKGSRLWMLWNQWTKLKKFLGISKNQESC